jgi:hypothetical protein
MGKQRRLSRRKLLGSATALAALGVTATGLAEAMPPGQRSDALRGRDAQVSCQPDESQPTEVHYWLQLENRPWDIWPNGRGRVQDEQFESERRAALMEDPLRQDLQPFETTGADALIIRRYTENWCEPLDQRINPWDLNEPDPRVTLGTIPGPVLECDVDQVLVVHFRNADRRAASLEARTHSLHAHGVAFRAEHDGAYPFTPQDIEQPICGEEALWAQVHVTTYKQGDRVPPPLPDSDVGGTFTYYWDTVSWRTTAGVWPYHDHSIHDVENTNLGAIGFVVIRDPLRMAEQAQIVSVQPPSALSSEGRWREWRT